MSRQDIDISVIDIDEINLGQVHLSHFTEANINKRVRVWKNDTGLACIHILNRGGILKDLRVEIGEFSSGSAILPADSIRASFIGKTLSYKGEFLGYNYREGQVPKITRENRTRIDDIVLNQNLMDLEANDSQMVLLEFRISENQKTGIYKGPIRIKGQELDGVAFEFSLEILDASIPTGEDFKNKFDIELWQYPYSVAEYYGYEPFSEDHLKALKISMDIYKDLGGHAITASIVEDAWDGQTYSKNDIHYPSMIRWLRKPGGGFSYDYSHFDAWVKLNKEIGIGDKIVLYSIVPWDRTIGPGGKSIGYYDEKNDEIKYLSYDLKKEADRKIWREFLKDLYRHLEENNWFDEAYMGIDERGFSHEIFDFIKSVKNSKGQAIKIAGAMDSFVNSLDLAMRVDDLTVGAKAATRSSIEFEKLIKQRKKQGLKTTIYSCTGHAPGQFGLSMPSESYWIMIDSAKRKGQGFLRWSYDAWVEDPLRDISHSAFEPGDCFLIYPDEKVPNPVARRSLRLVRMAEGLRDVNKLKLIADKYPQLKSEIYDLYDRISFQTRDNLSNRDSQYLNEGEKKEILKNIKDFKNGLYSLTLAYIELENGKNRVVKKRSRSLK